MDNVNIRVSDICLGLKIILRQKCFTPKDFCTPSSILLGLFYRMRIAFFRFFAKEFIFKSTLKIIHKLIRNFRV